MPVLVLNTCMDTNMQLTINSFRQLFPDKIFSLTFSKISDITLTAVIFPDISRQVVTLNIMFWTYSVFVSVGGGVVGIICHPHLC